MTHIERRARRDQIIALAVAWRDLMFFWKMFDRNARRAEAWLRAQEAKGNAKAAGLPECRANQLSVVQ